MGSTGNVGPVILTSKKSSGVLRGRLNAKKKKMVGGEEEEEEERRVCRRKVDGCTGNEWKG